MEPKQNVWNWLNAEVLRLLSELDPYALAPGAADGVPADEYDIEAKPIVNILQRGGEITAEEVDAVWQRWFGEPLTAVVGSEHVDKLVTELTSLARQPR
ncbi:hypothetical protein FBY40_3082 [Microbacterium sp. SLBN-154]|uniref:hypothetical protein n=1 Tax=Microbacterium sp. SLBN-154 TaxID=2768458 RepID=UPI001153B276|nr:hypothetical protein [Microbacterium sp. SLBN-154]TQK20545.1 hypothetical protein FBY40_3082 [Microbacterium sp. SLBN-154]